MIRCAGIEELSFMQWLLDQDYVEPKPLNQERYAAILPFIYTNAIVTGTGTLIPGAIG